MRLFYSIMLIFFFRQPLFAAEDQSLYRYPIHADSPQRLIYASDLMEAVQTLYSPELQQNGVSFVWNFHWDQDYVGAGSNYILEKKQFSVLVLGGQVRATSSNFEVLAAVLCHEFGHFFGGKPKQMFLPGIEDWSSSEGQSDWFAASHCLPRVYDHFKVLNPAFLTFHNREVTARLCLNSKDPLKCQWILGAAESLAKHFDEIYEHQAIQPSLLKKDSEVVTETKHTRYPGIQCRLDTMKEATFCADRQCERPACWFKKEWNFGVGCMLNCNGF